MSEHKDQAEASGRELAQEKHLSNLAETIRQEIVKLEDYARRTVKHALLAGKLLSEAKQKVGHGNWLNWFQSQGFKFSEVSAQRYMKLFRKWPELQEYLTEQGDAAKLTDMSFDSAMKLLVNPEGIVPKKKKNRPVAKASQRKRRIRPSTPPSRREGTYKQLPSSQEIQVFGDATTPTVLLKAAKTVLSSVEVSVAQLGESEARVNLAEASGLAGKVFANPLRTSEALETTSIDILKLYASGSVGEAIILTPTQVEAHWYRRFRDYSRVHLVKPDEETGVDWEESLTAIYLGDRHELFFEVFKSIGDGYVPYRSFSAPKRQ